MHVVVTRLCKCVNARNTIVVVTVSRQPFPQKNKKENIEKHVCCRDQTFENPHCNLKQVLKIMSCRMLQVILRLY